MSDTVTIKLSHLKSLAATRGAEFQAQVLAAGAVQGDTVIIDKATYTRIYHNARPAHSADWQSAVSPAGSRPPGLGDLVAKIATPIARALHMPCIDPTTKNLRPESSCAKRKEALNELGREESPTFHCHGGLGDCFLDLFERPAYQWLCDMKETDRARIVFWCSNPFAPELFAWHPKRGQIEILTCKNWQGSHDDLPCAKALGLKLPALNRRLVPRVPEGGLDLTFYPSPDDLARLDFITEFANNRPIIVIAPGAGDLARNIPSSILHTLDLELRTLNYFTVQVGRSYPRGARQEPPLIPGCYNAIDRLSVPGTARLVQMSAGLVTAHSSLNILGGFLRKPQLLIYPEEVGKRCFGPRSNRWAFGRAFLETTHCTFDAFGPSMVARLVSLI